MIGKTYRIFFYTPLGYRFLFGMLLLLSISDVFFVCGCFGRDFMVEIHDHNAGAVCLFLLRV